MAVGPMLSLQKNKYRTFSPIFLIVISSICISIVLWGHLRSEDDIYLKTARKIYRKGMSEQYAYELLKKITSVGPRLTGSPQAEAAVELTRQLMEDMGFDNVHLEPIEVPHWVRGEQEQGWITSAGSGTTSVPIAATGGSIAIPPEGISAHVVEVRSFSELNRLGDSAKGKIIFFNRPMDPKLLNTFQAYGAAAIQRVSGATEAAKHGAVGALVRSLTLRTDDYPHTGLMQYDSQVTKIPAACISTRGADLLSELLKKDSSIKFGMKLSCRELEPVISHNVVGDITGSERPDEIIVVGGHLDSWDLSPGAHDDAAGCAHSLGALRLIKELDLKPKRTIRAVMFMNEEFGGSGGRDYAAAEERQGENHLAAIESDRGGFLPLGFGVGNTQTAEKFKKWEYLFQSIGLFWLRPGGGGVDIAPLGQQGTLLIGLVPDSQRYFDVHHSGKDVIETVNPRELELGAIAIALFAYLLSEEGV
jgi:carboxypeptidase Q